MFRTEIRYHTHRRECGFLDKLETNSIHYNLPFLINLSKEINMEIFFSSINLLVDRHSILKNCYKEDKDGKPYQEVIAKPFKIIENVLNEKDLQPMIKADAAYQFDLANEFPIRICFYKTPNNHFCLINIHHIAIDGWSARIFFSELALIYKMKKEGKQDLLSEIRLDYIDFVDWQRKEFKKSNFQNKLDYWKHNLANYETLQLPTDQPRPAKISHKGAHLAFEIDRKLYQQLKNKAISAAVTLHDLILTIFIVLLRRYCNQDDIVIGMPIANRYHHELTDMIGLFVNTLAIRNTVNFDEAFSKTLYSVKHNLALAYDHQEIPFEKIVDVLKVERDTSRQPVFQILFNYLTFPIGDELKELNIIKNNVQLLDNPISRFDLAFVLTENNSELTGKIEYCTALFSESTMLRMIGHFNQLAKSILENIDKKIKDLNFLTDTEKTRAFIKS